MKRNTIIAIMVTFCFIASIFMVIPIQSQSTNNTDNPLVGINKVLPKVQIELRILEFLYQYLIPKEGYTNYNVTVQNTLPVKLYNCTLWNTPIDSSRNIDKSYFLCNLGDVPANTIISKIIMLPDGTLTGTYNFEYAYGFLVPQR